MEKCKIPKDKLKHTQFTRNEIDELANACGVALKKADGTYKKKAEIFNEIYMKAAGRIAQVVDKIPKGSKPSPIVPEQPCSVKEKCPSGYKRAELVEIANKCGISIDREPPKKGKKNMKELCEDILKRKVPEVQEVHQVQEVPAVPQVPEVPGVHLVPDEIVLDNRKAEVLRKIDKMEDMRGSFNKLLFTHNTLIPTFVNMIRGKYSFIRCCQLGREEEMVPVGRGAQFRYGLDSQYGEVKFILKPKFWEGYSKGVSIEGAFMDEPNFYDFFDQKGYKPVNQVLQYILATQALNYNFRHLDEKLGLENLGGFECKDYTSKILDNYQKGLPPSILDKPYPSWCNIQLHLGENVKYEDILTVLVPGFLKDPSYLAPNSKGKMVPISQLIDEANTKTTINGKVNHFKGKIIYGPNIPATEYYNYTVHPGIENKLKLPWEQNLYKKINKEIKDGDEGIEIPNEFMLRSRRYFGNSSMVAASSKAFREEQQNYMRELVKVGLIAEP